jgi:phosphoglucosamine mutase
VAASVKNLTADAGATITASHNPPEYNGIKLHTEDGGGFSKTQQNELSAYKGDHSDVSSVREEERMVDANSKHISLILDLIPKLAERKVVVDNAWGTSFLVTPRVLEAYQIEMVLLNALASSRLYRAFKVQQVSDDSAVAEWQEIARISDLSETVKATKSSVGIAHDGDADRALFLDEKGRVVSGSDTVSIFARYALSSGKGKTIVTTVAASSAVDSIVEKYGGEVVRTRVGDSAVSEKIRELGTMAAFGGEPSGAYIFPDISLCPDGPTAAAKFLEILDWSNSKPSALLGKKRLVMLETSQPCPNESKQQAIHQVIETAKSTMHGEVTLVDGVRVDFADSAWFLIRPSGTEPILRITAEASQLSKARKLIKTAQKLTSAIRKS